MLVIFKILLAKPHSLDCFSIFRFDNRVLQYSTTCEPGWGMPSGHMNAVTCGLLTLVYLYKDKISFANFFHKFMLLPVLALGCVSRVATGSHFAAQTLLGMCCGLFWAKSGVSCEGSIEDCVGKRFGKECIRAARFLIGVSLTIFLAGYALISLAALRGNPTDSLALAVPACLEDRHGRLESPLAVMHMHTGTLVAIPISFYLFNGSGCQPNLLFGLMVWLVYRVVQPFMFDLHVHFSQPFGLEGYEASIVRNFWKGFICLFLAECMAYVAGVLVPNSLQKRLKQFSVIRIKTEDDQVELTSKSS